MTELEARQLEARQLEARQLEARQLEARQRQALLDYQRLLAAEPQLFEGRAARPLVTDAEQMADYAAAQAIVLGVLVRTPYFLVVNDLVRSRTAHGDHLHPYVRIISKARLERGTNVVVLATLPADDPQHPNAIVLVEQERHALGQVELELPRGFAEPGVDGSENALRELRDETGYLGSKVTHLGTTNTDSGLTDAQVAFYHVAVQGRALATPEPSEAIRSVKLLTEPNLWHALTSGAIRDGFTLQALALFARRKLIP